MHNTLECEMYIADNPLTSGDVSIDQILEVLHSHANEFMPQRFCSDQSRRRKYSLKAVKQVLAKEDPEDVFLYLEHTDHPAVTYSFSFLRKSAFLRESTPLGLRLDIDLPDHPDQGKERTQHLVSLVTALANVLHPLYGYAHIQADASLGTDPHTSDSFAPIGVYEIHWLNIYGKNLVEQLGRERVLSTPCFHCEELAGGGVLLLSRPTPLDYASDEARMDQAAALAHLRSDVTYEQALAMLRQRSVTLFPTKDWDSDIADILEIIVTSNSLEERLRQTVEFNTYRPPEVSEWLPLDKLLGMRQISLTV
jgi:hypothetical protein